MKIALFTILKDLSIWMIYFILLRFNITGETFSTEMTSSFPGATEMSFLGMIGASLYISFFPILLDLIANFVIIKLVIRPILNARLDFFIKGMLFHIPILLFYIGSSLFGIVNFNFTSIVSLIASSLFAGLIWYLINYDEKDATLSPKGL